jgi:hypothetical protein
MPIRRDIRIFCDGGVTGVAIFLFTLLVFVQTVNPSIFQELMSWMEKTDGGRLAQELRLNPTLSSQAVAKMYRQGVQISDGYHLVVIRSPIPRNGDNDRILLLRFIDGNAVTSMNVRGSAGPQPRDPVHPDFEDYGGKAFVLPGQYQYRLSENPAQGNTFVVGVPTAQQRGRIRLAFDTNRNNKPDEEDVTGTDQALGVFGIHGPGVFDGASITSAGCIVFASEQDAKDALERISNNGQEEFLVTILDGDTL